MKKHAIVIGQNFVMPEYYNGWHGNLGGCQADAAGHSTICLRGGCEVHAFVTDDSKSKTNATIYNVRQKMKEMAVLLDDGDLLYFLNSGHGYTDIHGQGLVLADGLLYEDEFRAMLAEFKPGVRILCFLDICHAGGIAIPGPKAFMQGRSEVKGVSDAMIKLPQPDVMAVRFFGISKSIKAGVAIIGAALTTEYAYDGAFYGDFGRASAAWLSVWNNHENIVDAFNRAKPMVTGQTLNLTVLGETNPVWLSQPLFD